MRLFYGGPAQARMIGEAQWVRANNWTADVSAAMAAEALSQPGERFEVALDEPLRQLHDMTDDALLELAMAGVSNLVDLAALGAERVKELSTNLPKLAAWKRQAAGFLKKLEE